MSKLKELKKEKRGILADGTLEMAEKAPALYPYILSRFDREIHKETLKSKRRQSIIRRILQIVFLVGLILFVKMIIK